MATAVAAYSPSQLHTRVTSLLKELDTKNAHINSLQRNYQTLSNILHERLKLLDEASTQLVAERSDAEQLKSQLDVTLSRAEAAEKQLKHGSQLPEQVQQLRREADALRAAREDDYQQRQILQEQLNRVKQDLYATANSKQALAEQLQEQTSLNHTANTAVTKLRQQLEDEKAESRATASQLHALRDVLSRSMAQQQDMEKQLAALKARAKAAEDAAASELTRSTKLQQELFSAKGGQANNALKLLDIQHSQQVLEEKLSKAVEAQAQEQAARAEADKQVLSLQAQLAGALQRAEAAEAAAAAAAISLSQAQQAAMQAQAVQFAAEEARKTADAATKLVTHRLTEAQQQAAKERGIAEATQHELRDHLAQKDAALELQHQMEQGWRFRQLELMTRMLGTLDSLQSKVQQLDRDACAFAAVVEQQHAKQDSHLAEQLQKAAEWSSCVEELSSTGTRVNTALVHLQQQWVAKQQKLRSSGKGIQVLQKQLEQLEQQLSMSQIMERKLQNQLADEQAAREADRAQAQHELEQAGTCLAVAEAAATAAQNASAQQQAAVAQLETKLATAESEMMALRTGMAAKDSELAGMGGNVKAASHRLQRLARAATDMVAMLERVGALQPQDVAALLARLGAVAGRPSTASTPSRPSTPNMPGSAAATSVAAGSSSSASSTSIVGLWSH